MLWANAAEDLPYEGHTCQQNSPMLDYKPWYKFTCFRSLRPPPNFIYLKQDLINLIIFNFLTMRPHTIFSCFSYYFLLFLKDFF